MKVSKKSSFKFRKLSSTLILQSQHSSYKMHWFYRGGKYPIIYVSKDYILKNDQDYLIAIEFQIAKGFYLDVSFRNRSAKELFEERLNQCRIKYHSGNHLPNCFALSTVPPEESHIHSIRISDLNDSEYCQFVRELIDILNVSEIDQLRLYELFTHVQWFG